jgi:hypothetical protein
MRAVDPSSTTVLFGAGVTRAAGGPTAAELVAEVARVFVHSPEWRTWVEDTIQPRGPLRFETAMDDLSGTADPELSLLSLLDRLRPGPLHHALARAAAAGARLVTVNFDDLAEIAVGEHGLAPWTVDLQEGVNPDRLGSRGAVTKLHGTLAVHAGSRAPQRGQAPLHATISAIVAAGGGAGLPPQVEEQVRRLVDGRTLVFVGYSGSDDLDVMPSLSRCRPERVVWVAHDGGSVRRMDVARMEPTAARSLLERWRDHGTDATVLRGPSDQVLRGLGWAVGDAWDEHALTAAQELWRRHVREWAVEAHEHDPSGLGWVAEMNGSLGRSDAARKALMASTPSELPDGLWNPQKRLLMLAENAYLLNVDRSEVRRQADAALTAALARDDASVIAAAHHLKARSYRVTHDEDLDAAERELQRGGLALEGVDDPGREAALELEAARLGIAAGRDDDAARSARAAASKYEAIGELSLVAEALQVAGHARTLNGDHDEALAILLDARRLADLGPYPDRQVEIHLALGVLMDSVGDTAGVIRHARAALSVAIEVDHSELVQAYAMLGLALSEDGAFYGAAEAFASGLQAHDPEIDSLEALLACGLSDSLLQLGQDERAVDVLARHADAIGADRKHGMHAAAIRWRAGSGTEAAALAAVAAVMAAGEAPDGQTAFALARLAVPGDDAAQFLAHARELIAAESQHDRLARLDAAAAVRWS